jgi:hypothetical protein
MIENLLYRLDGNHARTGRGSTVKVSESDAVFRLRFRFGRKPKSTSEATEADRKVVRIRMHSEMQYRARQALYAIHKMRAAVHTYNKKQRDGDEQSPHVAAVNNIFEQLEAIESVLETVREK